jgi:hypothetical protein
MAGFIEGEDWRGRLLLPHCMDDYVGEDNLVWVVDVFGAGRGRSSSRRPGSDSRSARNGGKGPKRRQSLAPCRLAALVFRSALTPEHAEGR